MAHILVTSDRDRNEGLYRISRGELLKVLKGVGNDYPNKMTGERNPATGDFELELYSVDPSELSAPDRASENGDD